MRVPLAILLAITTRTLAQTPPCNFDLSVELINRTYDGVTYNDGEYIVDNQTGIERGCVCLKNTCARKCCPFGQGYDRRKKLCLNTSSPFDPPVWTDHRLVKGFDVVKEFQFIKGKMECYGKTNRVPVYPAIEVFHLKTDGTLYVDMQVPGSGMPWMILGPDKYCIDTFINGPGQESNGLNALICYPEQEEDHTNYVLSSTCMLISCFFILLTVGVYAWLPELRNLHGKVLIAYLLCFFVGFLFMSSMQIMITVNVMTPSMCTIFTFIIYFFLLGAFFWLNVMCFDIWWTFSGNRGRQSASAIRCRFVKYCTYAFGVPAVLTAILAGLEFSDLPRNPFLPNLKTQGCFLAKYSKLIYLYGPIVVLCVANLVFFILTAVKIAKIKQQTKKILKANGSSTHDQQEKDKQRFTLYIKLFAVMGFNWILEVISAVYPDAKYLWNVTDAYNVLVGLIIFIIFVCKKKTLRMIKDRYRQLRGLEPLRAQTTTSTSIRTLSTQSRESIQMNKAT